MPENIIKYNLEDRTLAFARDARKFVRKLPKDIPNIEDSKQFVRASGSIGANYIEANEALSKKDFIMRIKICRKESKECSYWLNLIFTADSPPLEKERLRLLQESKELTNIFGAIYRKSDI
jgi:four helix bundle protein